MRCCLFCIAVSNVLCSPCISVCFVYCLDKPRHISEGLSWLVSLGQLVWGGCLLRLNKRKKMHKKLTHQKICSVPCSFKWSHEFPRVAASTICVHSVNWCWPETNTPYESWCAATIMGPPCLLGTSQGGRRAGHGSGGSFWFTEQIGQA